jgi:hypothetical protein
MEKEPLLEKAKKDIKKYPYKWIAFAFTIISFIIILIMCWIRQYNAEQYYIHYSNGLTFTTSLWYFLISVGITYIGISFIIFTIKNFDKFTLYTVILFLIFNVLYYLFIFFIIPSIYSESNYRVMIFAILNIIATLVLGFAIYKNTNYPYISYIFIIIFLANNALGLTLFNVNPA